MPMTTVIQEFRQLVYKDQDFFVLFESSAFLPVIRLITTATG